MIGSLILLAVLLVWRWGDLDQWVALDRLIGEARALHAHPATPLMVIVAITLGSALGVPLSLLVVATVLVFGPLYGFFCGLVGAELSALLVYGIGRGVGRDLVRRYAGERLNRVSQRLAQRGVLATVALRLVPVAPFPVINLAAGASHIRFRDFALGTVLGLLPGTVAIALFAEAVARSIGAQASGGVGWWVAGVLVVGLVIVVIRRRLATMGSDEDEDRPDSSVG